MFTSDDLQTACRLALRTISYGDVFVCKKYKNFCEVIQRK